MSGSACFSVPGSPEAPGSAEASRGSGVPPLGDRRTSKASFFLPAWLSIAPFFLSALFFVSRIFAILSPLPLLFLSLHKPRPAWVLLASLTNSALVYYLAGPSDLLLFQITTVIVGLVMPPLLRRADTLERVGALTWLSMAATAGLVLGAHSAIHRVNPVRELKTVVYQTLDQTLAAMPPESRSEWLGELEPEEWKRSVWIEIPWVLGVFCLALVCLNLTLMVRLNASRIRERLGIDPAYFRNWKAPEWMIWPTLLSGFLLIANIGWPSHLGLNLFKFLMGIYALHGLSILGFFFELWNVRGFFRTAAYVVAVTLMMPLILSLGFFDLWFDFRSKVRQS